MKPVELPIFKRLSPPISVTPRIDALLDTDCVVAFGVSGGKDSTAQVLATVDYLRARRFRGTIILIHSDLGMTEWPQSLPWCEKLADRVDAELLVVRRTKGGMMERWEQRWADNCARYAELRCVQLILPWSTPSMRFCTSELKTQVICRELTLKFPGKIIISASGIRRQESRDRANAPIDAPQKMLKRVTRGTDGFDWHPIVDWSLGEVFELHRQKDFPLHPAYTDWGVGRVSCMDCIMQSDADAKAVAAYPGSHDLHRRIARLEIRSTFAFQGNRWRGDVAPGLLTEDEQVALMAAKSKGEARMALESLIPRELLYTKGWPHAIPTRKSAELLCGVRKQVAELVGIQVDYTEPRRLTERYVELWSESRRRAA